MILEKGDMWSQWGKTDLWLFTGNRYITKQDKLVMGRGLALEVKERIQNSDILLARKIIPYPDEYGVVYHKLGNGQYFGVFQVKYHFRDKARLPLIGYSCIILKQLIGSLELGRVDMNFPGIGYGRLDRHMVLPIIEELPDNVHVWER